MIQCERHQPWTPEQSPNLGSPTAKQWGSGKYLRKEGISRNGVGEGVGRDLVEEEWEGCSALLFQAAEVVLEQDLSA